MHLYADDVDVAHFDGAFVKRLDVIKCDPEFVLARTRVDIFVRMRIDVRIDAQRHRRARLFRASDAIDELQFRFALDIKAVNSLLERVLDFLTRFAHAGERAFCSRTCWSYRKDAKKLAAGYDVKTCARICEQFQDRAIRVRLNRVTNEMI